ncbi:MAG TPA: hypothetical protein VHW90_07200, partial [Stellaceae bacterium]|nr:hypothetical protein [Stellaceae bacterium]
MANFTWNGQTGQWTDPTHWQGDAVPNAPDTATFVAGQSAYVVTVASPVAIGTIDFDAGGATLDVTTGGVLTVGQQIELFAGTLSIEGTVDGGTLDVYSGSLNLDGGTIASATIAGNITGTGTLSGDTIDYGSFALLPSGTLTVTNGLQVDGSASFDAGGSSETITVS